MNVKHYEQVLNRIKAAPWRWNQRRWHSWCGWRHCFAGWAQILSGRGRVAHTSIVCQDACDFLEIERYSVACHYLVAGNRTIQDFEDFLVAYKRGELRAHLWPSEIADHILQYRRQNLVDALAKAVVVSPQEAQQETEEMLVGV